MRTSPVSGNGDADKKALLLAAAAAAVEVPTQSQRISLAVSRAQRRRDHSPVTVTGRSLQQAQSFVAEYRCHRASTLAARAASERASEARARPAGSTVQVGRERRPGASRRTGSRRTVSKAGTRSDDPGGDSEPPGGRRKRSCEHCSTPTLSWVPFNGQRISLCTRCVDRVERAREGDDALRFIVCGLERKFPAREMPA